MYSILFYSISSFRAKFLSFGVACFVFLSFLFAWRYFVFSSFRMAFFRPFVFSSFRVASFRREKTKLHNPATIILTRS